MSRLKYVDVTQDGTSDHRYHLEDAGCGCCSGLVTATLEQLQAYEADLLEQTEKVREAIIALGGVPRT